MFRVFRLFQQIRCFRNRTLATIHRLLTVLRMVPVLHNLMTMKVMTRDDEKI